MVDIIDQSNKMHPKVPPVVLWLKTLPIVVEAFQHDWERSQDQAGNFDSRHPSLIVQGRLQADSRGRIKVSLFSSERSTSTITRFSQSQRLGRTGGPPNQKISLITGKLHFEHHRHTISKSISPLLCSQPNIQSTQHAHISAGLQLFSWTAAPQPAILLVTRRHSDPTPSK